MITLPLDVIIIIINFLSYSDIVNLMSLYNHKIFEACTFYKKINIGMSRKETRKINFLQYFSQPKELVIKNGVYSKNNICSMAINNNWQLKKVVLNNIRNTNSKILYDFLVSQKNIETLELFLCNELKEKHLVVMNKNIKNLTLCDNIFRTNDIKHLTKFKKLEKLNLSHSRCLFNSNMNELFFSNLESLNLSNTQLTLDDRFFSFLSNLPKLKDLNLDFVITSYRKFSKINEICPKLKKFSFICSINIIIDNERPPLSNKWHFMNTLNIAYCLLKDENIIDIVDNCPGLKNLNVNQTSISDVAVVYITLFLEDIEKLFINANNITNTSANHIAIYLKKLRELDISRTDINNYYARKILKNNINMELILTVGCPNITYNALRFNVKKIII